MVVRTRTSRPTSSSALSRSTTPGLSFWSWSISTSSRTGLVSAPRRSERASSGDR
ncbi:MAG TPA: hypothetical protein VKD72_30590 [Gemmataceae bacterium]|nr:hypothetical protein [Gemmataceae bacterium]